MMRRISSSSEAIPALFGCHAAAADFRQFFYLPFEHSEAQADQARSVALCELEKAETGDGGPAVLIGTPWVEDNKLHNAYALLAGGRVEAIRVFQTLLVTADNREITIPTG